MLDADALIDQSLDTDMQAITASKPLAAAAKAGRPSKASNSRPHKAVVGQQPGAAPVTAATAATAEQTQPDSDDSSGDKAASPVRTNKRRKTASKPAARSKKQQRQATDSDSDVELCDASDDDGADADGAAASGAAAGDAAAAAAAAEAASFGAEEVTQINTALLSWYDRVMRILPWRRNPHHKPQQEQQQAEAGSAESAAPAAPAAAAEALNKPAGKQKKPSKAELAAAEAAAVVAAAKPAPADLSPQQFAYYVWVSEIMLQQTQVARVISYFNNWIAAWPTVQDLASATQEQVNEVWAGLGYYRRARYLLEGAQHIVNKLDGKFPETAAGMRQIPGVGPYTAAAVASISFNDPAAAVDGNVIRVISRLRALRGDPTKLTKTWDRLAAQLLHPERPGCHNQAMMELGATVCKPVNPLCEACPVNTCCAAYKQVQEYAAAGGSLDVEDAPRVTNYPEKVAKAAKHEQHVAVCVLKVLLMPPGITTTNQLAAAVAAAAGSNGSGGSNGCNGSSTKQPQGSKGGVGAAPAAGAGAKSSKQGNIRSFFKPAAKPAAAAAGSSGDTTQQQLLLQVSEADVLAAGGAAHYLLVQRPASGLLAGLWEFPGVVMDCEPTPKARRAAVDAYLSQSLGIPGLNPAASYATAGTGAGAAGAAAGGAGNTPDKAANGATAAAGVQVLHRRQLGSALHIFSHIRQTMHAEELLLLAPSLAAACPSAATGSNDSSGGSGSNGNAAASDAAQGVAGAASTKDSAAAAATKKRKGGAGAAGGSGGGSNGGGGSSSGGSSGGGLPCMRWVAAAGILQQGLTSGVRKVLQLSLK